MHDIPAILRLYRQLDRHHVQLLPGVFQDVSADARNSQSIERLIADEHRAFLLAETGGNVFGFVSLRTADAPDYPMFRRRQYVLIEDAVVDEQYRGLGIGSKLFEAALTWGKERGVRYIQTSVWSANAAAAEFYLSQGFLPIVVRMEFDTENQENEDLHGKSTPER